MISSSLWLTNSQKYFRFALNIYPRHLPLVIQKRKWIIWRLRFCDDYLASAIWLWPVLVLNYFGAKACLLDYYYTLIVVSRTVRLPFPILLGCFSRKQLFFQRRQQTLCVCLEIRFSVILYFRSQLKCLLALKYIPFFFAYSQWHSCLRILLADQPNFPTMGNYTFLITQQKRPTVTVLKMRIKKRM